MRRGYLEQTVVVTRVNGNQFQIKWPNDQCSPVFTLLKGERLHIHLRSDFQ